MKGRRVVLGIGLLSALSIDGPTLEVGLPVALFETAGFRPGYDDYAPSGNGERFLVKVPEERRTLEIHVLLNLPSLVPSTGP